MATTSTYQFGNIYASDLVIDTFERIGWRSASLTPDMLLSAQRSFNFVQSRWSNLGVNLWEVSLQTITLEQGIGTYTLDPTTIAILPAPYLRLWQLTTQTSLTPAFTTTASSNIVTVSQPNNGLLVGNYVNVATPVSVGGIVIFGFYPVLSTPSPSTYTIQLANVAASGTTGGTVPTFTTTNGSASVVVALNNQPFLAGQTFNVEVATLVGGLTLNGQYLITAAAANSLTIDATVPATAGATVTMNGGKALIESQPAQQLPTDRVLYPLSRPDYSSLAVKAQQGPPTSYWFDRTTTPSITFWPVPDQNGPYQFGYYKLSQQQDASVQGGANIDIPYRFLEAYTAACAAHLAMKWRPDMFQQLSAYAQQMWIEASEADREVVSFYLSPDFSGYFQ